MRVAMLCEAWYPLWGGGQEHVLRLSQALAEHHRCQIDIYTMNLGTADAEATHPLVRVFKVGPVTRFTATARLLWIFRVVQVLYQNHRAQPYALLHAHSNLPAVPGKILRWLLNIPLIYTVHGANFLEQEKRNFFYFVEKILLTKLRFDQQISVTRQFRRYTNVNTPVVIPNGVVLEAFTSVRAAGATVPHRDFHILFVGRFDRVKGLDLLLEALAHMPDDLNRYRVTATLAGDGPERKRLQAIAERYGLAGRVSFIGPVFGSRLRQLYQTADLFVLPSRSEGFPITILEAWAAHVPVLATRVGDNGYVVVPGKNGFLVAPSDVFDLRRGLHEAFGHPSRDQLGRAGYTLVQTNYQWPTIAQATYHIYKKLAHAAA